MRRATKILSMARAIAWFALSYGGAILGYLVVNALSARFLTAEFGSFVVAGTVATLVGQIALFGAHRGGLREAAVLTRADDASLANLRTAVQTISVIPLPVFALITAAVWFFLYAEAHFFPRTLIALSIGATVWLGASRRFWPTTCVGVRPSPLGELTRKGDPAGFLFPGAKPCSSQSLSWSHQNWASREHWRHWHWATSSLCS